MLGETRRRALIPVLLSAVCALSSGCTSSAPPDGGRPLTVTPSPAPTESVALQVFSVPVAHYDAGCRQAQTDAAGFDLAGERLVNLDPLFIRDNYSHPGDEPPQLRNGVQWLKDPYWVRAGQTVVVSVAPDQRSDVGLVAQYGPDQGASSVTFTACPASTSPYSWWPGGFVVHGTWISCIRLSVTVPGAEEPRRPVIPVGAASCPSSW